MKLSDTIEHMLKSGMRGRDVVAFVRQWEADQETAKQAKRTRQPSDLAEFRAELADVDADRIEAIVKHRRTKCAALTANAARLFRRDVEACGLSMAEGIDICISRNWITVKADWLRPASSRPSTKRESYADAYRDIIEHERATPSTDHAPVERLSSGTGHRQEDGAGLLLSGPENVPSYRH